MSISNAGGSTGRDRRGLDGAIKRAEVVAMFTSQRLQGEREGHQSQARGESETLRL